MKPFLTASFCAIMIACGSSSLAAQGRAECVATWGRSGVKSFREIQTEVQGRLGPSRILRVMLCGRDSQQYFYVVAMTSGGNVQTLQIAAR
jgi:hypothetical protein